MTEMNVSGLPVQTLRATGKLTADALQTGVYQPYCLCFELNNRKRRNTILNYRLFKENGDIVDGRSLKYNGECDFQTVKAVVMKYVQACRWVGVIVDVCQSSQF